MAFVIFPENEKEIKNIEVKEIFSILKEIDIEEKKPIALHDSKETEIKIRRNFLYNNKLKNKLEKNLKIEFDIYKSNKKYKYKNIKFSFGEGSRGNRGINNRGLILEDLLLEQIKNHKKSPTTFTKLLSKEIDLNKIKDVQKDGTKNNKRNLKYENNRLILNDGDCNIGNIVSDITLKMEDGTYKYLSIKRSKSVSFANLSISRFINKEEIRTNSISNKNTLNLLNFFGIDKNIFCKTFISHLLTLVNEEPLLKERKIINVTDVINKDSMELFIREIIGYGYYYCHLIKDDWKIFEMTEEKLKTLTDISLINIIYGANGTKSVKVEVHCAGINFMLALRNKNGGWHPKDLVCKYTLKENENEN